MLDTHKVVNNILNIYKKRSNIYSDRASKGKETRWICKECGTTYIGQDDKQPMGLQWKDGHICNPERVD